MLRKSGPTSDFVGVILFLVIDLAARWRGAVAVKLRLDSLMLLSFVYIYIAEIVCFKAENFVICSAF